MLGEIDAEASAISNISLFENVWQRWFRYQPDGLVDGGRAPDGAEIPKTGLLACFPHAALVASVSLLALGAGPCLELLALQPPVSTDIAAGGQLIKEAWQVESVGPSVRALGPGSRVAPLWPPFPVPAGTCLGLRFPEGGACPALLRGEISAAVVDASPEKRGAMVERLSWPEWESLFEAFDVHQDLAHPTVAVGALALDARWADSPGSAEAFLYLSSLLFVRWTEDPLSLEREEELWIDRLHGLLAASTALYLAACDMKRSGLPPVSAERLEARIDGVVALIEMGLRFLRSPQAPSEHLRWRVSFADLAALSAQDPSAGGDPRLLCPGGVSPFAGALAAWRTSGRVPPPPAETSRWPPPPWCGALVLGTSPPPGSRISGQQGGKEQGLRVAVVETHHMMYQETLALLDLVSSEFWGSPVNHASYLLDTRGGDFALSWGSAGPASARVPCEDPDRTLREVQSMASAEDMVRGWLQEDGFLRTADAVVSCSAVWACLALRSVAPELPVLIRINMGLLQFFHMWEDLNSFWEHFTAFVGSPLGAMAATSRLVAEQVYQQAGARPEHVPLVSLHLRGVTYNPQVSEVLVYRCRHPAFPPFQALLTQMAEASQETHLAFHEDLIARHEGKALPYEFLAGFRAVVLMPHVPNSGSFSDVYAMQVPLFLPAEPHIYRWMWAYSDPFAGPGGDPRKRSRAPAELRPAPLPAQQLQGRAATPEWRPPFDVFGHLEERMPVGALADRAYWFQFSEYAVLPAIQHFHGAADLLAQLSGLSPERAAEISGRMRAAHARRVHEASRWTACALARMLLAAGAAVAGG